MTFRGPYGPDRVEDPGFGVCRDCLRRYFAERRMQDLRVLRDAHKRFEHDYREASERSRAVLEAEAVIRDAELAIDGTE
jgi:hypothetical protein